MARVIMGVTGGHASIANPARAAELAARLPLTPSGKAIVGNAWVNSLEGLFLTQRSSLAIIVKEAELADNQNGRLG